MRRRRAVIEPALDLMSRHGAIAGVEVGAARLHALDHRLADFHGDAAILTLDPVGPVVTRAALDRFHRRSGNELQYVASLETEILHPQVAGHVIGDLAESAGEIRAHQPGFVPQRQILERIEYMR